MPDQKPQSRPAKAGNRSVLHWFIVLVVFSITGSLAAFVVGPLILRSWLGLEGGFWAGPWSYRLLNLVLIPPCYSVMLVIIGGIFGKFGYFRLRVLKIWSRLLPGPIGKRLALAAERAAASS